MSFSPEDKAELSKLITDALNNEGERRRTHYLEEQKANPPKVNTSIYLLTFPAHERIAFPDEKGRAILHDTFYARVTTKGNEETPSIWGTTYIEAIAFGDGKLLDRPVKVVVPHLPVMVEVREGFLETI